MNEDRFVIHQAPEDMMNEVVKNNRSKYPWRTIEVGQAFQVPIGSVTQSSLISLAYKTGKRLKKRFKVKEYKQYNSYAVARLPDHVGNDDEKKPND